MLSHPLPPALHRALPAACCVAFAAGITAQGACSLLFPGPSGNGSTGVVSPTPAVPLDTRYVLASGGGLPLPRVVRQDADGTITRVLADTLTLTPGGTADGTLTEVAILGVSRPGQAEAVTRATAAGVAYRRQSSNAVTIDALAAFPPAPGATGPASVYAAIVPRAGAAGGSSLVVNVAAGSFRYESP